MSQDKPLQSISGIKLIKYNKS